MAKSPKKPPRGAHVRRYQDGGSAEPSGAATSSSGAPSSYYSMMANLGGSLGGSKQSPYATTQGGNPYFRKGGKVNKVGKTSAKRTRR
jgi:hypothetical protein